MSLDTLLTELNDPASPVHATDLTSLSTLRDEDRARFLLAWRTMSVQRRRDIIDRLADMAEDNVELDFNNVFFIGLVDDDVQVRAESVKGLWEYEGDDLTGVLVRLLRDPEAIVRAEAALGLGRFLLRFELEARTDPLTAQVETALRGVATGERELPEVRARAIEALGARAAPWVHDLIEDAYASGDPRLRVSAVHAMGRSADPDWLPTIIEEMHSEDSELRFEAATAAGALGDEDAVSELSGLTVDDDPEVQEAAIGALGQIGGPAARSVLHSIASDNRDPRVLDAVSDALGEADFTEDPLGLRLQLQHPNGADEEDDE
ncbi:MAG: HEAT repeat domain-containing protein [Dehalococcoidia bacterium]